MARIRSCRAPARGSVVRLWIACVLLAPCALANTLADPNGVTIVQQVTGAGGGRMTSGSLAINGSAGQPAVGLVLNGGLALSHGVYFTPHVGGCIATGPSIVANVGDTVCIALPPGCPVNSIDPMYQWFRDDNPNALVDLPGVLTGVSTAELCIAAATVEDSDIYHLLYEDNTNTSVQYSVEVIVVSAVPASGWLALAAIAALLAWGSTLRLSNKYRSTGR